MKFNDKGNYADDGGLIQAASISVNLVYHNTESSADVGDFSCPAGEFGRGDQYEATVSYKDGTTTIIGLDFEGIQVTERGFTEVTDTCNIFSTDDIPPGAWTIGQIGNNKYGVDRISWCRDNDITGPCTVVVEIPIEETAGTHEICVTIHATFTWGAESMNNLTTRRVQQ